jgi:mono/diheme cytochrome c family protein
MRIRKPHVSLHDVRCHRGFLAACLLALIVPAGARAVAQAPPAAPANVDEGRKLFASYGCYQCHGYEGQGSSATGPRLGPRPLPLASFSRYVRRPTGQMPPYTTKVVSDSDLAKILAFLEARPAPPAVNTIPQLK